MFLRLISFLRRLGWFPAEKWEADTTPGIQKDIDRVINELHVMFRGGDYHPAHLPEWLNISFDNPRIIASCFAQMLAYALISQEIANVRPEFHHLIEESLHEVDRIWDCLSLDDQTKLRHLFGQSPSSSETFDAHLWVARQLKTIIHRQFTEHGHQS